MVVRPVLFLTSAFLAASGLLKTRSAVRHGLGSPVLPVFEVLLAVLVAALATMRPVSVGMGLGAIVASVLLLVASSTDHGLKLRSRRQERERSEGARLANYVRYLSGTSQDSE